MRNVILVLILGLNGLSASSKICNYHIERLDQKFSEMSLYMDNNMYAESKVAMNSVKRSAIKAMTTCKDQSWVDFAKARLDFVNNIQKELGIE